MAFPVPAARAEQAHASATTYTVTLPAGIAAGHLLLGFLTENTGTVNPTLPAGWTQLWSTLAGASCVGTGFYRIADGNEGASIDIDNASGVAHKAQSVILRITGAYNGAPEVGTAVPESGATNTDPPSLTPSWGDIDTLFIASTQRRSDAVTVSSYPTNYADNQSDNRSDGTSTGCATGIATRNLAGQAQNPGVFQHSGSTVTAISQTIAVRRAIVSASVSVTKATIAWAGQTISGALQLAPVVGSLLSEAGGIETAFVKSYGGRVHEGPTRPAMSLNLPSREEVMAKRKAEQREAKKRWPDWYDDEPPRMRFR